VLDVTGTVRQLDQSNYQVLLDGATPDAAAPPVRALVGDMGFLYSKHHAAGDKIRMKGQFSKSKDGQIVLAMAREIRNRPKAAAGPAAAHPAASPSSS
jgi:hypothetical protein